MNFWIKFCHFPQIVQKFLYLSFYIVILISYYPTMSYMIPKMFLTSQRLNSVTLRRHSYIRRASAISTSISTLSNEKTNKEMPKVIFVLGGSNHIYDCVQSAAYICKSYHNKFMYLYFYIFP
jgi:hypothetical protein